MKLIQDLTEILSEPKTVTAVVGEMKKKGHPEALTRLALRLLKATGDIYQNGSYMQCI